MIKWLLLMRPGDLLNRETKEVTASSLQRELKSLQVKLNRSLNLEADLEHRYLIGEVQIAVYERLKTRYHAEQKWANERTEAIHNELGGLEEERDAASTLDELRERFADRLESLSHAEWRHIFAMLNFELHICAESQHGDEDRWLDLDEGRYVSSGGIIEVKLNIPIKFDNLNPIAFYQHVEC